MFQFHALLVVQTPIVSETTTMAITHCMKCEFRCTAEYEMGLAYLPRMPCIELYFRDSAICTNGVFCILLNDLTVYANELSEGPWRMISLDQ